MIVSPTWGLNAVLIALFAYTVCIICAQPKYIFSAWVDMLEWIRDRWDYGYIVAYPLGLCEKCFAGQVALWVYLSLNLAGYGLETFYEHCGTIALAILATDIVTKQLYE